MYCMNIVVIGCDRKVLADVRREALNNLATIEGEFVDVLSAVNGLSVDSEIPRLFVVQVGSDVALSQLKRLSNTFVGRPIIALLEIDKDASMVVKAMRAGALQVALLPFARADFGSALDCIATQFGMAPARAKIIAVAGASGGCGTTTIALNLAYELACARELKCILLELSLRMGVLAAHLDVQPRFTTSDLLCEQFIDANTVKQSLTPIVDNLSLVSGPYQSVDPTNISPEKVVGLIDMSCHLAEVLVLDIPCTFDDLYFEAISSADAFVLVTQQNVSSIRGVQMVCEALPELPALIVVNQYNSKLHGFTAERLRALLKCPALATVADDPQVHIAEDQGRPLRLAAPRSRALGDIRQLMDALAPEASASKSPTDRPSFLGRLSRAFATSTKI